MDHAIDYYAHPEAGRNDHVDDGWQEDETVQDRESAYRKAIPYDDSEMEILAERLRDEPQSIETLMAIAAEDAHLAGLHLAAMTHILLEKRAEELAAKDQGETEQLNCNVQDTVAFEWRVENIKAALRKG